MSQTTGPRSDHWRAPWANPSPGTSGDPAAATAEPAPTDPATTYPATADPATADPGYPDDSGYPAAQGSTGAGHQPTAGYQYTEQLPAHPAAGYGPHTEQLPAQPAVDHPQPAAAGSGYDAAAGSPYSPWSVTAPHPLGEPAVGQGEQPPPPGAAGYGMNGPQRGPRRPGWGGVVAIAAGAAVLSSLLTAGAVSMVDNNQSTPASVPVFSSSSSPAAPLVPANGSLPNWGSVAAAVEPSVVTVQVTNGEGSGVILDTQGRILTNNHVVADAGNGGITVVLADGRAYQASVVGTDASTDLAVIKINKAPSGLRAATFGDSSTVKIGDSVMAIGNPLGLSDTVTTGIVSALNRPVSTQASGGTQSNNPFGGSTGSTAQPVVTNAIQTDAAINPGNSGGALVDSGGRVIGITSSIASLSDSSSTSQSGSIGLGFAIPVNEAKDVADQLVASGTVQHAYLGVTLSDASVTVSGAQRQAAVIHSVTANTPASSSGLQSGDAVIAINGQRIDSSDSLIGTVRALEPGNKITLTIVRNGATQDVSLTLTTRPTSAGG
jgi:putative serine protease PepD